MAGFQAWANYFFRDWCSDCTIDDLEKIVRQRAERLYEKEVNVSFSKEQNELGFLKLFSKNDVFIDIFKQENNQWNKIAYNPLTKQINKTPCN